MRRGVVDSTLSEQDVVEHGEPFAGVAIAGDDHRRSWSHGFANRQSDEQGEAEREPPCSLRGQSYFTLVIPRSRLLARLLRVLVACVALGMVCAAPTRAMAGTDLVAWIAGSRVAAPGEHPEAKQSLKQKREDSLAPARTAAERRPVHAVPAGARTIVVRSRLYLRHAALLR